MGYNDDFAPQGVDSEKPIIIELAGQKGILVKEEIIIPGEQKYDAPSDQTRVNFLWISEANIPQYTKDPCNAETTKIAEFYNDETEMFLEFHCDANPFCQDALGTLLQPELLNLKATTIRNTFRGGFNIVGKQITELFLDMLSDHDSEDVKPTMYALFIRGFQGDQLSILESLDLIPQGDASEIRNLIEPIERGVWVKPKVRGQND